MLKTYIAAQNQIQKFRDYAADVKERAEKDQSGAALIEYSVLIGLITVAVIGLIAVVGSWVTNKWTALNTTLSAHP